MPRSHAGSSSIEMTNKELRKALLKYGLPPASKELLELFPFHAAQVYNHLQEFPSPVPPEDDGCPNLKLCQMMVSVVNEFCYLTRDHKRHDSFRYMEYLSLNYRYQQALKSRSEAEENFRQSHDLIVSLREETTSDNNIIQTCEAKISELENCISSLNSQLEALQSSLTTKDQCIFDLEQLQGAFQGEITHLQDKINTLQIENRTLKRDFTEAFEYGTSDLSEAKEPKEDDATLPPSPLLTLTSSSFPDTPVKTEVAQSRIDQERIDALDLNSDSDSN